jgi:hypothetical protein
MKLTAILISADYILNLDMLRAPWIHGDTDCPGSESESLSRFLSLNRATAGSAEITKSSR